LKDEKRGWEDFLQKGGAREGEEPSLLGGGEKACFPYIKGQSDEKKKKVLLPPEGRGKKKTWLPLKKGKVHWGEKKDPSAPGKGKGMNRIRRATKATRDLNN